MPNYIVTDRDGKIVKPGDTVIDYRGKADTFERVERGPQEHHGTPKVRVGGWVYYCNVFGLTVKWVADQSPDDQ